MKFIVKVLVIGLITCAFVEVSSHSFPAEVQNFLNSIHDKCKAETGASEETIHSSFNNGKFSADPDFKCYLKCTMIELGTMDEHGEINVEAAVAKLPQALLDIGVDDVIRTCGIVNGADDCETAWLTLQCYQSIMHEEFITI